MTTKQTKIGYFILIFIFTILLYKQSTGLNIFLISIFNVLFLTLTTKSVKTKKWWLSAALWIGSGLSIFLSHTYLGGLLFFITGFNFISINTNSKYSFPFTLSHTFFSFIIGIAKHLSFNKSKDNLKIAETDKAKQNDYKILKIIFIYGTPLVLVIVFLKLYQLANPKFEEYTQFLSLEFIDWNFILLYAFLSFILYGFYLYNTYQPSIQLDFNKSNIVSSNYSDGLQKNIGTGTEQKMATLLLVTLNILIITFIVIDGLPLFPSNIDSELTHSETVHQGINILIISIILAIFILGFIFRGALNFSKNNTVKVLSVLWLILNLVITVFNSIKNYNYIFDWGLTHKRIGVFIYLMLCVIGLGYTIYKILNKKSFVFLIRRVSFSFVSFLVLYSLINWNSVIVNYNLNDSHFNESKIDFYYNYQLGYSTYPKLIEYYEKHTTANINEYQRLDYTIKQNNKNKRQSWKDIPSIKWFDYDAHQKLKDYKGLENNNFTMRVVWYD